MTNEIAEQEPTCKTCRYFMSDAEQDEESETVDDDGEVIIVGVCRRYPPVIVVAYPSAESIFPDVTGNTDWCGEYVPR